MKYIALTIHTQNRTKEENELLIAKLCETGFEGFEEKNDTLLAYIEETHYDPEITAQLLSELKYNFNLSVIAETNWNHQWEANFSPVLVDDFCTIKADFHEDLHPAQYEIIINPKMSFGTGHHATTQLMIRAMKNMDLTEKSVLDFGTGTGILAILAAKMNATTIIAIDHEEWAYNNAIENKRKNNADNIEVKQGTLTDITQDNFQIILANINRHVLLENMRLIYEKLSSEGKLIMSGVMVDDETIIKETAIHTGFSIDAIQELDGWIMISVVK